MKISGTSPSPTASNTPFITKTISTLLELIKPLSTTQALVKAGVLGEITLAIKEPLQSQPLLLVYIFLFVYM